MQLNTCPRFEDDSYQYNHYNGTRHRLSDNGVLFYYIMLVKLALIYMYNAHGWGSGRWGKVRGSCRRGRGILMRGVISSLMLSKGSHSDLFCACTMSVLLLRKSVFTTGTGRISHLYGD